MTMISKQIRDGYIKLIAENNFTHALTLKPNATRVGSGAAGNIFQITGPNDKFQLTASDYASPANNHFNINFSDNVLMSKLHKFHGLLDRELVARRFNEPQFNDFRTKIIAVCEGTRDTGHLHCAVCVHPSRLAKFSDIFSDSCGESKGHELWQKVAIGGTLVVKEIDDLSYWAAYMAKSLFGDNLSDRVIIR